jgi:hypothetical protein
MLRPSLEQVCRTRDRQFKHHARLAGPADVIRIPSVFRIGLVLAVAGLGLPALGSFPSLPGDCNLDWMVDLDDYAGFEACLNGPGSFAGDQCPCYDLDEDGDVDLHDGVQFQSAFTGTALLAVDLVDDADDGTEVDETDWHVDGYRGTGLNCTGYDGERRYDTGLRFHLPDVIQGETFVYARIVLPATGDGTVESAVELRVVGINQDGVADFSTMRPSRLPKTQAVAGWVVSSNWPDPGEECPFHTPLLRYSPDIAPIINEIVGRPGWGSTPDGKTMGIVIEDDDSAGCNYLTVEDYKNPWPHRCFGVISPRLELYRTVRSTFLGRELLGRPTADSITLNAMSLLTLEAFVEYGTTSGTYTDSTPVQIHTGGLPFEVTLDDLSTDTEYYYRLSCRRSGDTSFEPGPERRFHTQRAAGERFTFTVQSDSHLWEVLRQGTNRELYRRALGHIAADEADFHIALGDTFFCEDYSTRDVLDFDDAVLRHLAQRPFLDLVCHSAPFFMVLGNHEGEQGWRLDGTPDNVAVWATNARKLTYPLPVPDDFYTGSSDELPFVGLRENYYAWEWGDALFVVLDPYWYTTTKPHSAGGTPGSGDNWDWTLGFTQYDWLRETLSNSSATFKFVFSHQVTGGWDTYGRGGIEAASHELGGHGSFEWGGEDLSGQYIFDTMRPDWGVPIHQLMADNNVTIFFHGHDHVFVKQDLDRVIYQECPRPNDAMYGPGLFDYLYGDEVNNSGYLRVSVLSNMVIVQYVRAYLPGNGPDGTIAYSYNAGIPY